LGVVHRDISPPNILVSMQGQTKVSDFGIAKARYQLHERTKTGEVKGKFAYIPPEQISGSPVDRRADIYAMGCVLYVASLGARPFGNGADALRKILHNEYKLPRKLRPDYPEQLQAIIVKALAPSPPARFATAEDMQIALEEWLMSSGKLVTASDVARAVKERISPEMRARNEALLSQSRVAPDLLNRLISDHESETPTAGSGLVTAPPGLWVGKKAQGATPAEESSITDPGSLPSETLVAAAPVAERRASSPRASDATELVDFVPMKTAAATVVAPTGPAEPQASAPGRAKRVWLALLLLAITVFVLWRVAAR
jgi:serine/threonine-protein kinase